MVSIERHDGREKVDENEILVIIDRNGKFRFVSDGDVVFVAEITFLKDGKSYDLKTMPVAERREKPGAERLEAIDHFGIYEITDDTLVMCGSSLRHSRPTRIATPKDKDWEIMRLKRKK